jgi:deoxyuridine 5'-triphosphate nucleotidohydrolase
MIPGERHLFGTGLKVAIPTGYAGLILPRSGLALRKGVTVLNAPGLIDPDYRGEVGVLLINHGDEPVEIVQGERIAQLVVAKEEDVLFALTRLDTTKRGGTNGLQEADPYFCPVHRAPGGFPGGQREALFCERSRKWIDEKESPAGRGGSRRSLTAPVFDGVRCHAAVRKP